MRGGRGGLDAATASGRVAVTRSVAAERESADGRAARVSAAARAARVSAGAREVRESGAAREVRESGAARAVASAYDRAAMATADEEESASASASANALCWGCCYTSQSYFQWPNNCVSANAPCLN